MKPELPNRTFRKAWMWLSGLLIVSSSFAATESVVLDLATHKVKNPIVNFGVGNTVDFTGATVTGIGGAGTVTSVAVSGANGIGVSGSPITSAGTISLSLGAITPTTVNSLTLSALATGFSISGGTTSRTLTVPITGTIGTAAFTDSTAYQPLDSDLTSIAAMTTTSFGRSFLDRADAAAGRTLLGLGTLATQNGTFSGTSSGTNTGDQTLPIISDTAYDSTTWNANLDGASKNSIRDKIELLQPLDSDLTTIAGLTATTDNFLVSVSSAWASRTPTQVRSTLGLVIGTNVQAWDADLDDISGISDAQGDVIIRGASGWQRLAAGTDGFQLTTHSTGANPTWEAAGSGSGTPGGSDTEVQYNDSGTFDGITGATTDGTTLTLASPVITTPTGIVKGDVGLGSVTNDVQTKAAIVPNTAPSAGQILAGNAGGTAYAPVTLSGSGATATLSSAGVLTLSAIANATLSNSAITIAGTSTALGGTITQDTITGLSSTGLIKRTGPNTLTTITDSSSNWDTAFTDRLKWDGGATGLTASTGRTSLGATTVGGNIFTLTNPSAITFPRINADNTVDARSAANFRSDIGAGTGNGDALVANPLSQFAATTSLQLKNVISDETGSGALVFGTTPNLTTPNFVTGFTIGGGAGAGNIPIGDGTNFVASTPRYPNSASIAGKVIRADGTNFVTSTPTFPNTGTTGKIIVGDGTNYVESTPTYPNATAASGAVVIGDGTNFAADTSPTFTDLVTFPVGTTSLASYNVPSGTLKTTPAAGDNEHDSAGFYLTNDTTNSRAQIYSQQIYRLTADQSAISGPASDFFPSGSAIPTVTNGVYEIIFDVFFTKTTNGTVTWTITNTQTYTNLVATARYTATVGLTGANIQELGIVGTTTAAAALPTSTSRTGANTHHDVIRAIAECGTSGNIRLQVTLSAGTVTPLRDSMIYVRRLPAGNIGTFTN